MDEITNRITPYNAAAEQSVIGSIFMDRECLANVIEHVRAEDFYDPRNKELFEAIMDLFNLDKPIDIITVAEQLRQRGTFEKIGGEIYLADTHFKNTVVHEPILMKLLPVETDTSVEGEAESGNDIPMNFEPAEQEALELIIPKYVTSLIYGGMVESVASENGARMQAMDAATSNAEELVDKLTLQYNRARQGSITQELTEIIAGANAIS